MTNQEGPLDYSGHQPQEIRGYGLRAGDFRTPEEHDAISQEAFRKARELQDRDTQLRIEIATHEAHVKQSRDKAVYTRNQKGHSLTLWILFGGLVLWIPAIYYSVSPNHYWHA